MTDVVLQALSRYRINAETEATFQAGVERVLVAEGISYLREVQIGKRDRIDFLAVGGVGIELKTQGSESEVLRQLLRYAGCKQVKSLVLCTTRAAHMQLPRMLLGKPLAIHWQGGIW